MLAIGGMRAWPLVVALQNRSRRAVDIGRVLAIPQMTDGDVGKRQRIAGKVVLLFELPAAMPSSLSKVVTARPFASWSRFAVLIRISGQNACILRSAAVQMTVWTAGQGLRRQIESILAAWFLQTTS